MTIGTVAWDAARTNAARDRKRIAELEDALERIIESWNWQDPDIMREIAERALGRLAPTSGPAVPGMSRRISRNKTE